MNVRPPACMYLSTSPKALSLEYTLPPKFSALASEESMSSICCFCFFVETTGSCRDLFKYMHPERPKPQIPNPETHDYSLKQSLCALPAAIPRSQEGSLYQETTSPKALSLEYDPTI